MANKRQTCELVIFLYMLKKKKRQGRYIKNTGYAQREYKKGKKRRRKK